MPLETFPFDAARYLDSREAIDEYVDEVRQTGDPDFLEHALRTVARAEALHNLERRHEP